VTTVSRPTGTYRLIGDEPAGIAAISRALADVQRYAGEPTVSAIAARSGVHWDTVNALLRWADLADAHGGPDAAYRQGLELAAGPAKRTPKELRPLRAVAGRLRRPRLETLRRVIEGMGVPNPGKVAELVARQAPDVLAPEATP
jgi:hypothetical protein